MRFSPRTRERDVLLGHHEGRGQESRRRVDTDGSWERVINACGRVCDVGHVRALIRHLHLGSYLHVNGDREDPEHIYKRIRIVYMEP